MSKGLHRALAALLLAPLLYALLGFLVLPWAALQLANQKLAEYARVPAQLERIAFNPFSLELSLHGLRLGEPGAAQLGFARLYADLQLDSLWRGELHLRAVRLEQVQLELRLDADGRLNLTQLLDLPASAAPPGPPRRQPFPVRIDQLQVDAALGFVDLRQQPAVEHRYAQLALRLDNLTSHTDEEADLQLSASGPHGAALDWQGRLGLAPLRSSGRLSVGETALARWSAYLQALLPQQLQAGNARLSSAYRLDSVGGLRLQLDHPRLQLDDLRLAEADGRPLLDAGQLLLGAASLAVQPGAAAALQLDGGQLQLSALRLFDADRQPRLTLAGLEVADARLDLAGRRLEIGQLRSRQLQTRIAREADGRLDWQALLERQLGAVQAHRAAASGSATPSAAAPAAAPAAPAPTWQLAIDDLQLRGWQLQLEDRQPAQPVALQLGPLDLDLQDLYSDASQPLRLRLSSGVGPHGRIAASGQLHLAPLAGSLEVQASELDLRLAQAYLGPFVRLELRSGRLAAQLAVELQGAAPLAFRVSGSAAISQLHSLDTLKGRDLLRWQQLTLDGLDYRHGKHLHIDSVRLQQPYARFVINEDLRSNFQELLIAPPAPVPAASAAAPLPLRIGGIEIVDGSAHFADFSLSPNFATAIQQLNGAIGTLDNQSGKPARVDIRGKVDRYAPVSISGQLTPFSPLQQLDIATRFQRVELTTLTPYAGKFAGYKIHKGRLNLDLHYRIDHGRLEADNRLLLEDLQLGERVDSPSATDLPVRLAVALLKDADGNIDIALPLRGDLNNPAFSVAPIVWQTLRNLMLRATQAPFRLLAGLAEAGSTPLDSIGFAAGSSALDDAARGSLTQLAHGLRQRPTLRLEIEGMSLAALDGPLLAEQRLARELQDSWYRLLQRRGERVPADASLLEVPTEMQDVLLEGIYRARLQQQPPDAWRDLEQAERATRLRQALLAHWAQSSLLQRQLAQQRARAIKAWLVEQGGLADPRLYLLEVGSATQADPAGRIGVALHLDSE